MEIWSEKYRPKKLDEIVGHKEIVSRLKGFVKEKGVPHMLFAGPAGTGKTTAALCIAHELYGDGWKASYLELNASDARGIDVIRNQVKDFARTRTIGNAPFKIILLDEADALTPEAQQALRRTMENYTNTTRFILSANYSSRIIDPIQSRCAVFRFSRLKAGEAKEMLEHISKTEGVRISTEGLDAIMHITEGDMRRSINLLQACAVHGKEVTDESVYAVAAQARPEDVKEMVMFAVERNFQDARKKLYDILVNQGISGEDVVKEIHRTIYGLTVEEAKKLRMIEALGDCEFRIDSGGDQMIQLEAYLAKLGVL
ncbi:MAG: replication factor C small subunit [Candidatus Aenigmatarchaeota archaeon]|nr:MAG: replication factor C small subunit [Candidatus Aenigmarchaeota archaeon]